RSTISEPDQNLPPLFSSFFPDQAPCDACERHIHATVPSHCSGRVTVWRLSVGAIVGLEN
ncbi:hypothetical protein KAS10_02930, partial [Candidatus Aerophobetes bacterium]|nr:hypothetical protein [Candidatus Aerophobetes bacterium]